MFSLCFSDVARCLLYVLLSDTCCLSMCFLSSVCQLERGLVQPAVLWPILCLKFLMLYSAQPLLHRSEMLPVGVASAAYLIFPHPAAGDRQLTRLPWKKSSWTAAKQHVVWLISETDTWEGTYGKLKGYHATYLPTSPKLFAHQVCLLRMHFLKEKTHSHRNLSSC